MYDYEMVADGRESSTKHKKRHHNAERNPDRTSSREKETIRPRSNSDEILSFLADCTPTIKEEVEDDDYHTESPDSITSSNLSLVLKSSSMLLANNNKMDGSEHLKLNNHDHRKLTANLLMAHSLATSTAAAKLSAAVNNSGSNQLSSPGGSGYLLPCPLCETPLQPRIFRQHLDCHYPRDSPICPVIQCGRRFAHPNSVRNHMRIKHTIQWAKMKAMRSSGGPFTGLPDFK